MNVFDYCLVLIILIWLIAACRHLIKLKKQGRSICCGNCSACNACQSRSCRK